MTPHTQSTPMPDDLQESSLTKSLWRYEILNFIHPEFKKHKLHNGNCAFLPGSQAKEIEDVYEPLNLQRKNLYGIEQDPKIYEELLNKNIGINLGDKPQSLGLFLNNTKKKFNIISADLQILNLKKSDINSLIDPICERNLLNKNGFLIINKFNSRDNKYKKEYLKFFNKHFKDKTFSKRSKIELAYTYKIMNKLLMQGHNVKLLPPIKYNSGRSPFYSICFQLINFSVNGELKQVSDTILKQYNQLIDLGNEKKLNHLKEKGITSAKQLEKKADDLKIPFNLLKNLAIHSQYNLDLEKKYVNENSIIKNSIEPYDIFNFLNSQVPYCKQNNLTKLHDEIIDLCHKHTYDKFIISLATGTGKTRLALRILDEYIPKNYKTLFVTVRNHIHKQAKDESKKYFNFDYATFKDIKDKSKNNYSVVFSTIHLLNHHLEKLKNFEFDCIIIDEAHHITTKMYQQILEIFKPKKLIGLTATPFRTDKQNVIQHFDNNVLYKLPLENAVKQRYLVPNLFNVRIGTGITLNKIKFNYNGEEKDFAINSIGKQIAIPSFHNSVVNLYKYFFANKNYNPQTIIFCVSVPQAKELRNLFKQNSINAEVILNDTKMKKREKIVERFNERKINVLINVNILTEGLNCPSAELLFMLRPTLSLNFYTQALGRPLRYFENKKSAIIVDFTYNFDKHADFLTDNTISMCSMLNIKKFNPLKPVLSFNKKEIKLVESEDQILEIKTGDFFKPCLNWTNDEINKLRKYYPTETKKFIMNEIPNRTWEQIVDKACKLGTKRNTEKYWKNWELKFIEYYPTEGEEFFKEKLPHRSYKAIKKKALKMGIFKNDTSWQNWEKEFIKYYYPTKEKDFFKEQMSHRTWISIRAMASLLDVKKENPNWTKNKLTKLELVYFSTQKKEEVYKIIDMSRNEIDKKFKELNLKEKLNEYNSEQLLIKVYEFHKKNNRLPSNSSKNPYERKLANKLVHVRKIKEEKTLKLAKNLNIQFIFENFEEKSKKSLIKVYEFHKKNNRLPSNSSKDSDERKLANWIITKKRAKNGKGHYKLYASTLELAKELNFDFIFETNNKNKKGEQK